MKINQLVYKFTYIRDYATFKFFYIQQFVGQLYSTQSFFFLIDHKNIRQHVDVSIFIKKKYKLIPIESALINFFIIYLNPMKDELIKSNYKFVIYLL